MKTIFKHFIEQVSSIDQIVKVIVDTEGDVYYITTFGSGPVEEYSDYVLSAELNVLKLNNNRYNLNFRLCNFDRTSKGLTSYSDLYVFIWNK